MPGETPCPCSRSLCRSQRCVHSAGGRPVTGVSLPIAGPGRDRRRGSVASPGSRCPRRVLAPQPQPPGTHPPAAHLRSSTGPPAVPAAAPSLSPPATPAGCLRWWYSVRRAAPPCLPRVRLAFLGCPPGGSGGSHWRPQLAHPASPTPLCRPGAEMPTLPPRDGTKLVTNPMRLRPHPSRPHSRGRLQPPRKTRAGPAQQNTRRAVRPPPACPLPRLAPAPANRQRPQGATGVSPGVVRATQRAQESYSRRQPGALRPGLPLPRGPRSLQTGARTSGGRQGPSCLRGDRVSAASDRTPRGRVGRARTCSGVSSVPVGGIFIGTAKGQLKFYMTLYEDGCFFQLLRRKRA